MLVRGGWSWLVVELVPVVGRDQAGASPEWSSFAKVPCGELGEFV
jgi:hypothetical protein